MRHQRRWAIIITFSVAVFFIYLIHSQHSKDNSVAVVRPRNWAKHPNVLFVDVTPVQATAAAKIRLVEYSERELPSYQLTAFNSVTSRGLMKMAVHGSIDFISRFLMQSQTWEPDRLRLMQEVLDRDPRLQLIDLGCNLGVFTLTAAAMGRQVIALDANVENVKRLRKSLLINKLEKQVRVVYNAISDSYTFIQMGIVSDNIGGSIAIPVNNSAKVAPVYKKSAIKVPTITMNDLVPGMNFSRCMMKMDLEGFEYFALLKSKEFFKKIHVPFIMMEWAAYPTNAKRATWIIKYMTGMGYKASADTKGDTPLHADYRKWPGDINWVKK